MSRSEKNMLKFTIALVAEFAAKFFLSNINFIHDIDVKIQER